MSSSNRLEGPVSPSIEECLQSPLGENIFQEISGIDGFSLQATYFKEQHGIEDYKVILEILAKKEKFEEVMQDVTFLKEGGEKYNDSIQARIKKTYCSWEKIQEYFQDFTEEAVINILGQDDGIKFLLEHGYITQENIIGNEYSDGPFVVYKEKVFYKGKVFKLEGNEIYNINRLYTEGHSIIGGIVSIKKYDSSKVFYRDIDGEFKMLTIEGEDDYSFIDDMKFKNGTLTSGRLYGKDDYFTFSRKGNKFVKNISLENTKNLALKGLKKLFG